MPMTPEEAAAQAIAAAQAAAGSAGSATTAAEAAAADRAAVQVLRDATEADRDQVEIWRDSVGEDKAAVTELRDATADDRAAALAHKNAAATSRAGAAEDRAAVQAAKEQVDLAAQDVQASREAVQNIIDNFAPSTDNPVYQREIRFLETPLASELLDQIEFRETVQFPANLGQNSGRCRGIAPSSPVTFILKKLLADGTDLGTVATISVATNRTITRATTGGAAFSVPAGGALQFFAPADAKGVTRLSEILVGTRVDD